MSLLSLLPLLPLLPLLSLLPVLVLPDPPLLSETLLLSLLDPLPDPLFVLLSVLLSLPLTDPLFSELTSLSLLPLSELLVPVSLEASDVLGVDEGGVLEEAGGGALGVAVLEAGVLVGVVRRGVGAGGSGVSPLPVERALSWRRRSSPCAW